MRGKIVLFLLVVVFTGCTKQTPATNNIIINKNVMRLTSSDFVDKTAIDPKFTCDGDNLRPELSWFDVPAIAKSMALAMFDPDAPGDGFVHWLVVNLPVQELQLDSQENLPIGAEQIKNDTGKFDYFGPCPPQGVHHYQFTLYALDLNSIQPVDYQDFLQQIDGHIVEQVTLTGLYERKR